MPFGLFLILYALGRAVIEMWRGDDQARGMLIEDYVSTSQFLSFPVLFIGVAIYMIRKSREQEFGEAAH